MKFKLGDIVWADFRSGSGHVQRGRRPCLIVSTNRANGKALTVNVIPGTTKIGKYFAFHVHIKPEDVTGYVMKETVFLVEQITTIDKDQILCMAGKVNKGKMSEVDKLIKRQLGFNEGGNKSE